MQLSYSLSAYAYRQRMISKTGNIVESVHKMAGSLSRRSDSTIVVEFSSDYCCDYCCDYTLGLHYRAITAFRRHLPYTLVPG